MPLTDSWVTEALTLLRQAGLGSLAGCLQADSFADPAGAFLNTLRDRKIDSLAYLAGMDPWQRQNLYDRIFTVQRMAAGQLSTELAAKGADPLVFKGLEIAQRFFAGRGIGMMTDVDVLIRRDQVALARTVVYDLGYRQASITRETGELAELDPIDVAQVEASHYELVPYIKAVPLELSGDELAFVGRLTKAPLWSDGDTAVMFIELDVHHRVALDIPSTGLFERAIPGAIDGARTLSDADHLWLLTSRYYTEVALHGKRSLRDFAYVAALLARGRVDWDVLLGVAKEYELTASLFYYLSFLDVLLESVVPEEVLAELKPTSASGRDWGWQLGPLFDFIDDLPAILPARCAES